ncbi:hypothetical protein PROFUN_16207 [Planoprotostelium fungivorum]|uniref:Uncharacterized protein n=1 Tax=Planoprotostelium fungivorum TaxID=1890364 RepID=A0A2P6MRP2_9EUKA|nr:hypothetical protein PROFUN_16207 [Planoprotostelium fungivorum]
MQLDLVYLALSSKKIVQRSIRWAQIERVLDGDTMDLPMISQPCLRGYSRGERDKSLLLTNLRFFSFSGCHVTSLCHNLNIFGFLPLYSWCGSCEGFVPGIPGKEKE